MVGGFLGTLISVEKIIPLKRKELFAGPLAGGLSLVAFMLAEPLWAHVLLIVASLNLCVVYLLYVQRHQKKAELLLGLAGAVCWLIGTVFLLSRQFYPLVFPWWMAFILLTIVSERLELTRFLPVSRMQQNALFFGLALFVSSLFLPSPSWGRWISGAALVLIGAWLLRFDLIRLTIRKQGQPGFTATALFGGYLMLVAEGALLLLLPANGYGYDIIVHLFFIGFTFSMIFAHGPIILPGVLGVAIRPYHRALYLPLAILYFSLLLRVAGGLDWLPAAWYRASGWVTVGSIAVYASIMMVCTRRALLKMKEAGSNILS